MYDLYEYADKDTNVTLAFKFEKANPIIREQKAVFLELLKKASADLEQELNGTAV